MKLAAAALFTLLAVPGLARAQPGVVHRDLILSDGRAVASVARFDLVGLHWRGTGDVIFRTRGDTGRWSAWRPAAPEDEDRPDAGARERTRPGWRIGNPWWAAGSTRVEVRARGRVGRVRAYLLRSRPSPAPPRAMMAAASPAIIPRLAWSANERRRDPVEYASAARYVVIHHTAGVNSYTRAQSPAIVRSIQQYHVAGNGWNDIGYNFLVDKYGQVFEGRFGGIERPVIGAHAGGFNTGSVGIAVIGSYGRQGISAAARAALVELIAWRLDVAHVDPLSTLTVISNGNERFGKGLPVMLRAVVGHRDTGFTDCPGAALYVRLGELARTAATTGGPKLYTPAVTGTPPGRVRFTARLSQPVPWTVTVTDAAGRPVAVGSGVGTALDWTWDATAAAAGTYRWTMRSEAGARGASGLLRAKRGAVLSLTGLRADPLAITPNGDGRDDATTITYELGAPAAVKAKLFDSTGREVATLLDAAKPAGKHRLLFGAENVPDGAYDVVITASAAGRQVQSVVSVLVSRTLAAYAPSATVFSPNGDRVLDTIAFRFSLAAPAAVRLRVLRRGVPVATAFSGELVAGVHSLKWDGRGAAGRLPDGRYDAEIEVTDAVGRVAQRVAFTSDTTPPGLSVASRAPLRLRVSEPARVTYVLNGRRGAFAAARAGTYRVAGLSLRVRLRAVARDPAGNASLPLVYTR